MLFKRNFFLDVNVYKMYIDQSIKTAFNEENKFKYIPVNKKQIFALCYFNYEQKDEFNNELLKIFKYHITTWCEIKIKSLYKIHNNETIIYNNPFFDNIIIGHLNIDNFQHDHVNKRLFLISPNNNINNICIAYLDVNNNSIIEVNKISLKKEIKSLINHNLFLQNNWKIIEYELLETQEILLKLEKTLI